MKKYTYVLDPLTNIIYRYTDKCKFELDPSGRRPENLPVIIAADDRRIRDAQYKIFDCEIGDQLVFCVKRESGGKIFVHKFYDMQKSIAFIFTNENTRSISYVEATRLMIDGAKVVDGECIDASDNQDTSSFKYDANV